MTNDDRSVRHLANVAAVLSMRTLLAFTLIGTLACSDRTAVRLEPVADPFVYNGSASLALPVRALSAEGASVAVALHGTSEAPQVASVEKDSLRCLHAGDARIAVTAGTLRTSVVLQCRPIQGFGPPIRGMDLVVGGPPVPLAPQALDSSGQPVLDLRFSAISADTSVVTVQAGAVVPRGFGHANVRLDFGGIRTEEPVEVVAPVVRDSVQLVAGEHRSWKLGPGRYLARVEDGYGRAAPGVVWRSNNANCARDSWSSSKLHCVLSDTGAVVLFAQVPVRAAVRIDQRTH